MVDFTKFTTEDLKKMLRERKEKLTAMLLNDNIEKIISEAQEINFILRSRGEDGQEDSQSN